jgi:hypothetical protein
VSETPIAAFTVRAAPRAQGPEHLCNTSISDHRSGKRVQTPPAIKWETPVAAQVMGGATVRWFGWGSVGFPTRFRGFGLFETYAPPSAPPLLGPIETCAPPSAPPLFGPIETCAPPSAPPLFGPIETCAPPSAPPLVGPIETCSTLQLLLLNNSGMPAFNNTRFQLKQALC